MSNRERELKETEKALPELGKLTSAGGSIGIVNKYPAIDHPRIYETGTGKILFVSSPYTNAGENLAMTPMARGI